MLTLIIIMKKKLCLKISGESGKSKNNEIKL